MFTHLCVHSNFSFCRGASRIEDLVNAALARGMAAMALTDINGVYGLIWFLQCAAERGLRPIVGAELRTDENARLFWRATGVDMRLSAGLFPGVSTTPISACAKY
jgi:DNA polymerase III alpha subunit